VGVGGICFIFVGFLTNILTIKFSFHENKTTQLLLFLLCVNPFKSFIRSSLFGGGHTDYVFIFPD